MRKFRRSIGFDSRPRIRCSSCVHTYAADESLTGDANRDHVGDWRVRPSHPADSNQRSDRARRWPNAPAAPSLAEYGWVTRSVKPMQSAVITPMKSNPASPDSSTGVEQGQGIISAVRLCSCLRNVRNSAEKNLFCERRVSGTPFAKWKIASNVARPSQPGFFVTQTFARRHWNGRPGVEPDALRRDSGKAPPPTRSAVSEPSTRRSYPRPPPGGLRVLKRHSLREC